MILKGSQRGGGQNLAVHLMRTDENEHVELHELRGFISDDLHGAFKEAQAVSRGTKCRQYLFSLSLNPPDTECVPVEVFVDAVGRIEEQLGLEEQPRAIVFHEKERRRHAHCVWSRIDAETMTAKQMSFFKTRLTEVSRELYLEHDWKMPRGLSDRTQRDPRNFTLEEWQQAKRVGHDPRVFKAIVQDAWAMSDGKTAFFNALKERGLWLAQGDRRGHVIVDHTGEIYGLARTLSKKTKEVRRRIGDEKSLPSIAEAKAEIADQLSPVVQKHIDTARQSWKDLSATLAFKKEAVGNRHQTERAALKSKQEIRAREEARARTGQLPKGVRGLWSRITGNHAKIRAANQRDALASATRDIAEREELTFRQLSERRRLQSQVHAHRSNQAALLFSLRGDRQSLERMLSPERVRRRDRSRDRS